MATRGNSGTTSREKADPIDRAVGDRIRSLRQARGISQSRLGASVGVSLQQVQKYEYGVNRLTVSMMIRLAEALDVAPEAFVRDLTRESAPAAPDEPDTGFDALVRGYASLASPTKRAVVLALLRELGGAEAENQA